MYLDVDLLSLSCFEFVEPFECVDKCFLSRLGSLCLIISADILFAPFSLVWESTIPMLALALVFYRSLRLCSCFCIFFSFCFSDNLNWRDQVCALFILLAQISCRTPLVNFSFQLLCFSMPELLYGYFYIYFLLIDFLYLVKHSLPHHAIVIFIFCHYWTLHILELLHLHYYTFFNI